MSLHVSPHVLHGHGNAEEDSGFDGGKQGRWESGWLWEGRWDLGRKEAEKGPWSRSTQEKRVETESLTAPQMRPITPPPLKTIWHKNWKTRTRRDTDRKSSPVCLCVGGGESPL